MRMGVLLALKMDEVAFKDPKVVHKINKEYFYAI